jgi:cyclase
MYQPRVVPCLLLDEQRLVKTQKFASKSYVGDPINAVKIFNDLEVDELILLDIQASKKNIEPDFDHISEIVSEAFMPVAVGGGIKSIDQAAKLINIGVEKIIVNTGAHKDFQVIRDISQRFGNQSTVLAIDIKKIFFGGYKIYDHTKKHTLDIDIITYIEKGICAGAGEIFLNFVDNDGLGIGYNLELIKQVSQHTEVPLIVCGGAGKLEDLKQAVIAGATATAAGSIFVYTGKHRAVMINYPGYLKINKLFNE